MTLWVKCPNCGPICALNPQGRAAFHLEITCYCGVKAVHDEGCSQKMNKPKNEHSSC